MVSRFVLINTTKTTLGATSLIQYLCAKKIYHEYIYAPKNDDNLYSKQQLKLLTDEIKEFDIIGFSSFSISEKRTLQLMSHIKEAYPKKLLILGGPNVIMGPARLIKKDYVDAVCIFEGEIPLEKLIKIYPDKKYLNIPGFWFKVNKSLIKNEFIAPIQDLEKIPFINYKKNKYCKFKELSNGKLLSKQTMTERIENPCMQGNFLYVMASRGCPYSCSYCINNKLNTLHKKTGSKIIRKKDTKQLIDEIKKILNEEENVDNIFFFDDDFFIRTEEELMYFSKEYKEKINIPFFIFANPNSTTKKKIDLCYNAGLVKIEYGLQTVVPKVLKKYNRRDGTKKLVESINYVSKKNYKLIIAFDIITNSPFENDDDIMENIHFILNLKGNFLLYVHNLHLFPGSKLREEYGRGTGNEFKEYQNNLVGDVIYNEYFTKLLMTMQGLHEKNNPEIYGTLTKKEIISFIENKEKKLKENLEILNNKIKQTEVARYYSQQYCSNKVENLDVNNEC